MILNYMLGIGILFLFNNVWGLYVFETDSILGYVILGILGGSMFHAMVTGVQKFGYLQILGSITGGMFFTLLLSLVFQSNTFFLVNGGLAESAFLWFCYSVLAYLIIIIINYIIKEITKNQRYSLKS